MDNCELEACQWSTNEIKWWKCTKCHKYVDHMYEYKSYMGLRGYILLCYNCSPISDFPDIKFIFHTMGSCQVGYTERYGRTFLSQKL